MSVRDSRDLRVPRLIALVTGLVGFLAAILTPLLPVQQDQASIDWPQPGATSVEAPLVGYVPQSLNATIPCSAIAAVGAGGGNLFSTVPPQSSDDTAKGLVVRVVPAGTSTDSGARPATVEVIQRDNPLLSAPVSEIAGCREIAISATAPVTSAEFVGTTRADGTPFRGEVTRDIRPQVVGLFTDLNADQLSGANAHIEIDSRFTSTPSAIKIVAMALAVLCTLAALIALHILDGTDRRRARRFLPAHWWRFTGVDGVVVGVLLLWHFIGANTSDDGYILTMARVADHAGYMANYFRWYGVPEAPFGWYYDVFEEMAKISTASPWMRLPALIAAILCWMVISREVLPRLGTAVRRNKVALWTGGLLFLAFWLPYDNGLRPEPVIALGALLTWCSIERAIATGRLLPAAIAALIAAFSLAAGPTGLICIAALIAGSRPLLQVLIKRGRVFTTGTGFRPALQAYAPLVAPLLAAGTLVLIVIFGDQTLSTVMEATRVRTAVGPNVVWFDERVRWDALMSISPDGSLARRFGVLTMLLCLGVCVLQILRKGGRIPGTSRGPSARILGIVFASLLLMMFTPTKWTHHYGVYAGLAGSLGALAAVAVGQTGLRSPRNRTLFAAAVSFVLAMCFTGSNGWWYVSSYGIPWWDKAPSIAGKGLSTAFLGLTVLLLLIAAWQHYREPYRTTGEDGGGGGGGRLRRWASAPLTIAAAFVVVFEVLSFVKGAVSQRPAYSLATGNLRAIAGDTCGLANDVLVENDPNSTMLTPLNGSAADGLDAESTGAEPAERPENTGFTPDGVATDLTADEEEKAAGGANTVDTENTRTSDTTGAGTGGGTEQTTGINGSSVTLPFGLDPAQVPVLGSYQNGDQHQASLTTEWYGLDRSGLGPDDKILAITAAGRIASVDADGIAQYGQEVRVEYGTRTSTGVELRGSVQPLDIGPSPSWRNLRVPLADIPAEANAVRIVAVDNDITQRQWVAVTPPRVPHLETLDSVVGHEAPVLLDWSVGLAFPCQRPFDHQNGVAEVPDYRILPDRVGADSTNAWQDDIGGGPLGWTGLLLDAQTMPTYLNDDWRRDWGSLERFTPLDPDAVPAEVSETTTTRSGVWRPDRMRVE
ncbi:arabinosyltransferase domain-containing protein [Aldersonia sp. NBC_00410]|uniref:arabinosyltransferase domain-containing protein n=1 Tax=Aldersonia sp. NBC_00410 TaxID=2975954 RepID=UPI00224D3488|nr:arabinosyltransferase domain-containing protein [Aldersonia sp. NBC_00410]MCX5042230.1 arabinosyltransferase domain-containing protein [Aldersonia sp. NBC_00410]